LNTLFSAFQFTKTKTEEQVGKKKNNPQKGAPIFYSRNVM